MKVKSSKKEEKLLLIGIFIVGIIFLLLLEGSSIDIGVDSQFYSLDFTGNFSIHTKIIELRKNNDFILNLQGIEGNPINVRLMSFDDINPKLRSLCSKYNKDEHFQECEINISKINKSKMLLDLGKVIPNGLFGVHFEEKINDGRHGGWYMNIDLNEDYDCYFDCISSSHGEVAISEYRGEKRITIGPTKPNQEMDFLVSTDLYDSKRKKTKDVYHALSIASAFFTLSLLFEYLRIKIKSY